MIKNQDEIIKAAVAILMRCDGAIEQDGVGFNGTDANFMREILMKGEFDDSEINEIYERLHKYRKQLSNYGYNYDNLKPIEEGGGKNERKAILYSDKKGLKPARAIIFNDTWKDYDVPVGKWKGKSLYEVVKEGGIDYIEWVANQPTFSNVDFQKACVAVMNSQPVEKPKKEEIFIGFNDDKSSIVFHGPFDMQFRVKDMASEINCRRDFKYYNGEPTWWVPTKFIKHVLVYFPDAKYDGAINTYLRELDEEEKMATEPIEKLNIDGFGNGRRNLFDFQHIALEFMQRTNGKAIIGDDMGLGKTTEALAFAYAHKDDGKIVVICPAPLKYNWAREFNICFGETTKKPVKAPFGAVFGEKYKCAVLEGTKPSEIPNDINIVVINYNICYHWMEQLKGMGFLLAILDEAHYIRNYRSPDHVTGKYRNDTPKHAIGAYEVASTCKYRLMLTGTPMVNRPKDLYPLLSLVNPKKYPNNGIGFMEYGKEYCDGKREEIGYGKFAWNFNGASNLDKLNVELKDVMIRRLKSDVLKELPTKTRVLLEVDLTNKKDYNKAESEFLKWLGEYRETHPMLDEDGNERPMCTEEINRLTALRKLVGIGKVTPAGDWIADFLETGNKLIVFCWHSAVVNELYGMFSNIAVVLDGELNSKKKDDTVQAFQNDDKVRLIICNILTGGTGHTLTAASNVLFLELGWRPADHDQAEARALRIGQKNAVTCFYMLARATIDERILDKLETKRAIADAAIDGKEKVDNLDYDLFPDVTGSSGKLAIKVKAKEVEMSEKQINVLTEAMFVVMKQNGTMAQADLIKVLQNGIKEFEVKPENVRYIVNKWDGYVVKTGEKEGRSIILKYIKSP